MAKPSLQASQSGQRLAEQSLQLAGLTKTRLSNAVGCSRQPVTNFFKGVAIEQGLFLRLCDRLNLDWQLVAGLADPDAPAAISEMATLPTEDVDSLVRSLRRAAKDSLYERCGTMRVLDMSAPIELGEIYTEVNILAQISSHQRVRLQDLQRQTRLEDFERIGFGVVAQDRVPVMDAVAEHKKLIVLGKPGAGKTTFLKHLAIACSDGHFEPERLPLFVNLKQFADSRRPVALLPFLSQRHFESEMTALQDADIEAYSLQLKQVLNAGRALLLLDGLDEVNQSAQDWVLRELQLFSESFHDNHFLMTCRVAAWEYTFEQFTEVEVADFGWPQIERFAQRWFAKKAIRAEDFIYSLRRQPYLAQLAVTPLLLTLLCLAFEMSGAIPSSRSELYREGVETLLKKWDASRGIHRDQVYKRLSTKRKEDLLSYMAIETFPDDCFFSQRMAEQLITDYIRRLPEASDDPEVLQVDSTTVLHSIEAQHGLLVERFKHCYSFSHRTFHEYFVARELVYNSNSLQASMEKLVADHALDSQWREIFLLVSELLRDADLLLRPLQARVNALIADSAQLQDFLSAVCQQADRLQAVLSDVLTEACQQADYPLSPIAPAALRAFFFDIDFEIDANRSVAVGLGPAANWLVCASFLTRMLDEVGLEDAIAQVIRYDDRPDVSHQQITQAKSADEAMIVAIEIVLSAPSLDAESRRQLEAIRTSFLSSAQDDEALKTAADAARDMAKRRYRMSQPQPFDQQEKTKKELYYKATKLLLDCLNSDGCMLTLERRQAIKDGLFVPVMLCP